MGRISLSYLISISHSVAHLHHITSGPCEFGTVNMLSIITLAGLVSAVAAHGTVSGIIADGI
jgi:uncharacterized membrane protein